MTVGPLRYSLEAQLSLPLNVPRWLLNYRSLQGDGVLPDVDLLRQLSGRFTRRSYASQPAF